MTAFLEKRLSREEGSVVEKHLADCARCRREAAALARSFEAEAVPLPVKEKGISFGEFVEGLLAPFRRPAPLLALASAALVPTSADQLRNGLPAPLFSYKTSMEITRQLRRSSCQVFRE